MLDDNFYKYHNGALKIRKRNGRRASSLLTDSSRPSGCALGQALGSQFRKPLEVNFTNNGQAHPPLLVKEEEDEDLSLGHWMLVARIRCKAIIEK
ncbi:hypothetical protein HPP92_005950 [Vanilla planifolia]|uniref:Uncharacterized protein n=1 Tax=Vanilla planifolia TaxID=51239 RepID=A0A835RW37_VANPL|nr:hypothetical protein HPP92_006240 [Vanilla planifolia]KAG0494956.1 hypothetical protein HPP92_005950 [Vanilla planifolia]